MALVSALEIPASSIQSAYYKNVEMAYWLNPNNVMITMLLMETDVQVFVKLNMTMFAFKTGLCQTFQCATSMDL
jgi:hypothetical protein